MHSSGRDEILGTAYSDHDLVVFLEGAGVAEPDAVLDDPEWVEWVEWRGGPRPRVQRCLTCERRQRPGRADLPGRSGYSQGRGSACQRALSQSGWVGTARATEPVDAYADRFAGPSLSSHASALIGAGAIGPAAITLRARMRLS